MTAARLGVLSRVTYQVAERFGLSPVVLGREWNWMQVWLAVAWLEDVDAEVEAQMKKGGDRRPETGGRRRENVVVRGFEGLCGALGIKPTPWPKRKK